MEEEELIVLIAIVVLGALLYLQYVIAKHFEEVARQKGHGKEMHVFAMCFWLNVVGYIYVASLPDKYARPAVGQPVPNTSAPAFTDSALPPM